MIKRGFQFILLVVVVVAMPFACKARRESATTDNTQTIAPAPARPAQTTTAEMTQTLEVPEEARGEAEGGALTDPNAPVTATTTAATTTGTKTRAQTGTGRPTAPTTATTRTQ